MIPPDVSSWLPGRCFCSVHRLVELVSWKVSPGSDRLAVVGAEPYCVLLYDLASMVLKGRLGRTDKRTALQLWRQRQQQQQLSDGGAAGGFGGGDSPGVGESAVVGVPPLYGGACLRRVDAVRWVVLSPLVSSCVASITAFCDPRKVVYLVVAV